MKLEFVILTAFALALASGYDGGLHADEEKLRVNSPQQVPRDFDVVDDNMAAINKEVDYSIKAAMADPSYKKVSAFSNVFKQQGKPAQVRTGIIQN